MITEESRIIDLQRKFSNGQIDEEDITEEDKDKLSKLYDVQIMEITERIEKYKKETLKIIKNLKRKNSKC